MTMIIERALWHKFRGGEKVTGGHVLSSCQVLGRTCMDCSVCPVFSPKSLVARRRGGVSEQTHLYNQYGILSLRSGPLRSGRLGGFLLWCAILVLTRPANVALVFIVAIRLSMSSGKSVSRSSPHVCRPFSVSVIWIPVIRIRTLVRQLEEDQQHQIIQQRTLVYTRVAHAATSAR